MYSCGQLPKGLNKLFKYRIYIWILNYEYIWIHMNSRSFTIIAKFHLQKAIQKKEYIQRVLKVGEHSFSLDKTHLLTSGTISRTTSVRLRETKGTMLSYCQLPHIPSKPAHRYLKWHLCILLSLIFGMKSDNRSPIGHERGVPKRVSSPRL